MHEEALPESLNAVLIHLLDQVGEDVKPSFEPQRTAPLLAFLESPGNNNTLYYPAEMDHATSAFYWFEMASSMDRLLGYAYNDAIPSQVLSPSSLRAANRLEAAEGQDDCWQWQVPAGEKPQIVRFAEHEEVTPDLFTGAYYGYDVDRTLILYRFEGRNVFLSLSRQRDISEVGKKGVALGGEENWDYLYSDETGLNKKGLGWVKSYIYNSFSVTVFYETRQEPQRLRCGTFKWLNAGWAKINMVKRGHIRRGLERYASDLSGIIENRNLPVQREMAEGFSVLQNLSSKELRLYMTDYLDSLAKQYAKTKTLSRDIVKDLLAEDKYAQLLNMPQMLAVVELEYLKALLGKQCKLPGLTSLRQSPSISDK